MKSICALLFLLSVFSCSRFQYDVDGARMKGTIVGSPIELIQSAAEAEVVRAEAYRRKRCAEDLRCLRETSAKQEQEWDWHTKGAMDTSGGGYWGWPLLLCTPENMENLTVYTQCGIEAAKRYEMQVKSKNDNQGEIR
ncbi:MAG: hypothetical protein V1661_01695 [bacterium]